MLTTYHPCSAERRNDPWALTYPEPLGPPRPVVGDLYLYFTLLFYNHRVTYFLGCNFLAKFRRRIFHRTFHTYLPQHTADCFTTPTPNQRLNFTFMLQCVVTDFFLITNQTYYLSKFIPSLNSTCFGQLLCLSSGVSYCIFGSGKFHAVYDDRFQTESGWNCLTMYFYNICPDHSFNSSQNFNKFDEDKNPGKKPRNCCCFL